MRIAILGGSFDPIHKGHLQIAKTALKKLAIEEVWFMPSLLTPLKQEQTTSYYDRCQMILRAIAPYRHMRLSTLEGEWKDRSFTIRTVKELLRRYPMHSFCWLIGDDQAQHFDQWKASEELKQLLNFYVFNRANCELAIPKGMWRVKMELIAISSSQLRAGKQLYQLPRAVHDYIGKHGLYLEEMIKGSMKEQRYVHSVSVAKLCVELAHAHGLDEHKAYCMGMVHDVCKQMPKDKALIWMNHHMPDHVEEVYAIWHGYIGASYIKQVFHMYDKAIGEAVFHHVKGRNTTDYDRILYIADKLDPSRGYDSSNEIALSKQNLKKGFMLVKQQQIAYLKQKGTI